MIRDTIRVTRVTRNGLPGFCWVVIKGLRGSVSGSDLWAYP